MGRLHFHRTAGVALALLAWASPAAAEPQTWQLDEVHTFASFKVRYMTVTWIRGEFVRVRGKVTRDPAVPKAMELEVTIEAGSVRTDDAKRDIDLRGESFLDVEKHPLITFKSRGVKRIRRDGFDIEGDLTIKGVSRPITLQVTGPRGPTMGPWGKTRMSATARTTFKRRDFGVTWNRLLDTGGPVVGDDVQVEIEAELIRL